jgi:hypothetical protein
MGTGGSRYGAGRPGWRGKCENYLRFDVRDLHRRECLQPGRFGWQWSRDGKQSASTGVEVGADQVTLTYQVTPRDREPITRQTTLRLWRTNCHFGGSRHWFGCPWCGRRCAIVYGISSDGYFACRRCLRLGYSTEAEDSIGRLWRKQHKLEARLGEDLQKPKWMRVRTYQRIWSQIDEVEEQKHAACMVGLMAILSRGGLTLADM